MNPTVLKTLPLINSISNKTVAFSIFFSVDERFLFRKEKMFFWGYFLLRVDLISSEYSHVMHPENSEADMLERTPGIGESEAADPPAA